jgi:hypothetical protein
MKKAEMFSALSIARRLNLNASLGSGARSQLYLRKQSPDTGLFAFPHDGIISGKFQF